MERSENPHDPRHLGVPSGVSKMISNPMVRSTQTAHLSCVKISTISKQTETSFQFSLVTLWYHTMCPKRFLSHGMFGANLGPILHRHEHHLQTNQNMIQHDPCHLGVPSGVSKMTSEPMVRSAQTVHLSCVKTSTISKRTKTSVHVSLVT